MVSSDLRTPTPQAPWIIGNELTVLLETESMYGRSLQLLELVMITISGMNS